MERRLSKCEAALAGNRGSRVWAIALDGGAVHCRAAPGNRPPPQVQARSSRLSVHRGSVATAAADALASGTLAGIATVSEESLARAVSDPALCAGGDAGPHLRPGTAFGEMVRQRQGDRLDQWLADAEVQGVPELRSFAKGLRKDYQAVKAGLTLEWSNGPTEGHVNKLKLLKRLMYGRASFALLRQRVLSSA